MPQLPCREARLQDKEPGRDGRNISSPYTVFSPVGAEDNRQSLIFVQSLGLEVS